MADSKDLDFDELDKAVNSLMGTVEDKEFVQKSKTLDINETLAPNEAPAYRHLDEAAKKIGNEAIDKQEQTVSLNEEGADQITKLPSLPLSDKKAGGRFMDVVHPSSDMRTALIPPPPRKVSREGVAVAPAANNASEVLATTAGNLPPAEEPQPVELTEDEPTPAIELPESLPPLESDEPTSVEPLISPFLPDAKVEKRPLGGVEPAPKTEEESKIEEPVAQKDVPDAESEEKIDTSDWTPLIQPEDTPVADATMPSQSELDEDEPKKKDDEFSKMDAMDEAAKNLTEVTEHIPEEFKNELLEVEKVDTPAVSTSGVGVVSIPQQYQEKPSSGDQTNGAIYDTDHYHKPVAHQASQKSGWTWVLVVVVLIIVGALLGAGAYFLGLV